MYYMCQTCNKKFLTEDMIRKHLLKCWKEKNPNHKSKEAPRGENIVIRQDNDDIMNFFNDLRG